MTSPSRCPLITRLCVLLLSFGVALVAGLPVREAGAAVRNAEDLLIVDCLLPGQLRKLGRQATYITARRPIRTSQADCEIRGGEYVAYDRANYQTALKVWLEGAMAGNPEAQNNVGEIYAKGLGTDPDYGMALQWFRKAAEQGYARAKINLGFLYEQGLGVEKDPAAALNLYREASGIEDALMYASVVQVEIRARDERITGLEQQVREGEAESARLREQVEQLKRELAQRRNALQQAQRELVDTRNKLTAARQAQDDDLTRLLENQLLAQEEQINAQRTRLAALQQRAGAAGGGLYSSPMLEILDPVFVAARGRNTAVYPGGPGTRKVVGRVTAPQLVKAIEVNGRPVELTPNGGFAAEIEVPAGGAQVSVVAVDTAGARAELQFNLLPQASGQTALATAPVATGELPRGVRLGRYHALVIGNNAYRDPSFPTLQSAGNDANAVADVLRRRYGYQVELVLNGSRLEILSALDAMREKLKPEDNLLVYYAGHGEIDGEGQGYWVPSDGAAQASSTWISNAAISDILDTMSARHVMVVADSCYSGTLSRASVPTFDPAEADRGKWDAWVKAVAQGRSRTVLSSGGVMPVPDTGSGQHSYFARAFLNVLQDNNRLMPGQRLFQEVSTSLALGAIDSPLPQIPEYAPIRYAGHESGDFLFLPAGRAVATGP
ncbi:MAG TPA: caspase family protein [Arenimonas sp.]|nr:caspase family protein [Arenimonas sp.]